MLTSINRAIAGNLVFEYPHAEHKKFESLDEAKAFATKHEASEALILIEDTPRPQVSEIGYGTCYAVANGRKPGVYHAYG